MSPTELVLAAAPREATSLSKALTACVSVKRWMPKGTELQLLEAETPSAWEELGESVPVAADVTVDEGTFLR